MVLWAKEQCKNLTIDINTFNKNITSPPSFEFIYKTDLLSYIELGSNLILTPNSFPSNVSAGKALISGVSNIKSVMATFALGSKFF